MSYIRADDTMNSFASCALLCRWMRITLNTAMGSMVLTPSFLASANRACSFVIWLEVEFREGFGLVDRMVIEVRQSVHTIQPARTEGHFDMDVSVCVFEEDRTTCGLLFCTRDAVGVPKLGSGCRDSVATRTVHPLYSSACEMLSKPSAATCCDLGRTSWFCTRLE